VTDFVNRTGDPVFEGSVEQALTLALESARHLTVFRRGTARAVAAELAPDKSDRITEETARLIARREGINIVIAGAIALDDGDYRITLRASDPATGAELAAVERTEDDKEQVLDTIIAMTTSVREALGESRSELERLAEAETVTAGSLEAMRAYARAQELTLKNNNAEALQQYQLAVKLDPSLGRAYAGMGVIYTNIFKDLEQAEKHYQAALQYVGRMTERERYRTLGTYYLNVARNYEKAIENYEALVKEYPADDAGHGNLALAYMHVGDVARAVAEVKKVVEIYPRNSLQRYNYAMYSMYVGDFATAIAEGTRLEKEDPTFEYYPVPLSISQLASGDVTAAMATYDRLEKINSRGAAFAAYARADAAMYHGRYRDAIRTLLDGIAADRKAGVPEELPPKYLALAEAYLETGNRSAAVRAAVEAAKLSRHESTLFPAARVLARAGSEGEAAAIAVELENVLQRQTTAYAALIRGEIAAVQKRTGEMIDAYRDAQKRHDSWFSRFLLGRAYVETDHYVEALAELEIAAKRHGETTDAYFTDHQTLRYLPATYYWLGRAQEGLGALGTARTRYEEYIRLRQNADPGDALTADARERLRRLSAAP
jgi:tetratricopeptide (TPR) repeat protein